MGCQKVWSILWYHVPNKLLSPEKLAHHVMLFFSVQSRKIIAIRLPTIISKNTAKQGVQDVVNRNKIKFKPYGDLVDETFSQIHENSINN